jgi:hypothetical protein
MVFLRAETELSRPWVKPDKENMEVQICVP